MTLSQASRLKLIRIIAGVLVALTVVFVADCASYLSLNPPGGTSFNKSANGIWLRYLWYFGKKSPEEKDELVERLSENQIEYAYFHVRSTDSHGNLLFKYEKPGSELVELLHRRLPKLRVVAWLYVPSNFGRVGVDLENKNSRANLVASCKWLTDRCGFDGVQIDYEFFPNTDKMFPQLLDETRAALGPEKLISVATPMWYPGALWGWDAEHFSTVSAHCDQIAVMGYDSWLYHPRAYVWLMEQQAIQVTRAVSTAASVNDLKHRCSVIIGIPVYDTDKGTPAHMTYSENLVTALKGIRHGLKSPDAVPAVFEGVAPFAEYTMDEDEWKQYRRYWLEEK